MSHALIQADCVDGLATLADKSAGCAIFDAPYSEHTHAKVRRGGSVHAADKRPSISTSVVLGFEALTDEVRAGVAAQLARIVRRWVVAFSDAESVHLWQRDLEAVGFEHVRVGAWIKVGGSPQFTGDRPGIGFEALEIAHQPGRKRWNAGGQHGLWSNNIEQGERIHKTQKPLPLMETLVRDFTDPGELILDPFSGSCTTGVACKRLGRDFIGFERGWGETDEERNANFAAALKRLETTEADVEWSPARGRKAKQGALL